MTTQELRLASTGQPVSDDSVGRWAVTSVFFLNGLTLASYLVRVPAIKHEHQLSNGQLGALGMLFAAVALVAMQFVAPIAARFGNVRILRIALLVMPLALIGVGVGHDLVAFCIAIALLGAVQGTLDVSMNAYAVAVERLVGRPILSGCHAAWSISAVTASLTGAVLLKSGVSTAWHFVVVAAVVALAAVPVGRGLTRSSAAHGGAPRAERSAPAAGWRTGWTRTVIRLGLIGMVLMTCEGAALGWSGVFLHESRGASLTVASIAVTAYTGSQTAGRLVGDRLALRYGRTSVFRTGGLLGAAGLAIAVSAQQPALSLAGFAICGLGSSVLLPLTFSAAGHAGAESAAFLSRFTTFTYAGILLGPALIGWAAQLVGLTWTLAGLIPILACTAMYGRLPTASRDAA